MSDSPNLANDSNPAALPRKLLDAQPPQKAIMEAIEGLRDLAEQHDRAVRSLLTIIFRLMSPDRPMQATVYMMRYAKSEAPDAEAVAAICSALEASLPAGWQERRAKATYSIKKNKEIERCERGQEVDGLTSWAWDAVMASARKRRDVIAAAVAVCEQRGDEVKEIATALGEYLKGEHGIHHVEWTMNKYGLSVEGAKIIPLLPRGR